jgi:alpha-L-rhamnosidase
MQQGETYDASKEEISDWHEVKVENYGTEKFACPNTVPILEQESFEGKPIRTPNGERVMDFGQNLAGYVEFTITAHEGEEILLWHGESLDENGNFTNANFQPGDRHKEGGIWQRITYICKEGVNHYKPSFTIMGFRYVKVETNVSLENAQFIAHAVYSQMEETGSFTCSSAEINQLVHNSIWSQKSNFCDIPTDCPTRERAGWTGDAGVFVDTGLYLMDAYPVFRKWLRECRFIQKKDGKIANIAPPNNKGSLFADILSGSTGWGDACIIVPYTLYQRYGDVTILEENYDMMKRWYGYLETRAGKSKLKNVFKKNPYKKYTIDSGIDYGEWCEPDVDSKESMKRGTGSVATAYLSYSGGLLGQIAQYLGKTEDAAHYREVSMKARKAYRFAFTEDGRIQSDRQCEYVRPLAFGLLDEEESQQAAADLQALIVKNDYHLNTGFLSTPFLSEVLVKYGYLETASRLVLQDTVPGWLYAVKKGATTVWETWDGIRPDGTVHDSLNHYAYGVITGWFFKRITGIRLEVGKLILEPQPLPGLTYAKAKYQSPMGNIESEWWREDDLIKFAFVIPPNLTGEIKLPDGRTEQVLSGRHIYDTRAKRSCTSCLQSNA